MEYGELTMGVFLERLNRFVARVEVDGAEHRVHVRNTGRCRELLVPGNTVYLLKSPNPERRTPFDLIAVERGDGRLITMDSRAPNRAAAEWLAAGGLGDGSRYTVFPGTSSSLQRPVFRTWTRNSSPPISTRATKRFSRSRNSPCISLPYSI